MSQSLYQIEQDALALEQLIFESGGEITPAIEAWLAEVETNLSTKCDNYKTVMDRLDMASSRLSENAKKYQQAAKSVENIKDRLKDNIKSAMVSLNLKEVVGPYTTFKLVNGASRLVIHDEKIIDSKYKVLVTTTEINKAKLKADLEAGEQVVGAELQGGLQLRSYVSK